MLKIQQYPSFLALPFMFVLMILGLSSCKNGFNKLYEQSSDEDDQERQESIACRPSPVLDSTDKTEEVLTMIAKLSCEDKGVISGQSLGYGNEIVNDAVSDSIINSYKNLIEPLADQRYTLGIVSIDYEYNGIYTSDELIDANDKLKEHWDVNGLVLVSWSPHSPWLNPFFLPGIVRGSDVDLEYSNDVDLTEILDIGTDPYDLWIQKLDHIIEALKNLQAQGVVVLFRPFPEMNTNNFWWGTDATADSDEVFIDIWQDMVEAFRDEGLDNILWVFAPTASATGSSSKDITWGYPGKDYVDIIAPVLRKDSLSLTTSEYNSLRDDFDGLPLGFSELGPAFEDEDTENNDATSGEFDNRKYADQLLDSNQAIAFWISGHDRQIDADTKSFHSIENNENKRELFDFNSDIFTAERIVDNELLSAP